MAKDKSKTNAMRIAESKKVSFEVLTYDCEEFMDGVSIAEKLGQPAEQTFKTLVTQGKSRDFFVCVVPVANELDLKKAAKVFGEKSLEMIHVKDIFGLTGYVRGGCSPIGMKKQFRTAVHESALGFDRIMFSGGRLGAQIKMSPKDLEMLTGAVFADIIH